ncbi:MAG TPA: VOC family protein [Acidimicrobiales bacterium]|nr:VOC family protein [Acidimicrobiales bacterium]
MPVLRASDLYHTGVVVADLDASLASMAALGGYRWMDPFAVDAPVWTPDGATVLPLRFAYSLDPPYLELVQSVPGTVWEGAPGNAVHHVGCWVDDLAAASTGLTAEGRPMEVCGGADPSAPLAFAYHRGTDGIRIELVDRRLLPDFPAFLREHTSSP